MRRYPIKSTKPVAYRVTVVRPDGSYAPERDVLVAGVRKIGEKLFIADEKIFGEGQDYLIVAIKGGRVVAEAPEPTDTPGAPESSRAAAPSRTGAKPRRRNQAPISVSPRGATPRTRGARGTPAPSGEEE